MKSQPGPFSFLAVTGLHLRLHFHSDCCNISPVTFAGRRWLSSVSSVGVSPLLGIGGGSGSSESTVSLGHGETRNSAPSPTDSVEVVWRLLAEIAKQQLGLPPALPNSSWRDTSLAHYSWLSLSDPRNFTMQSATVEGGAQEVACLSPEQPESLGREWRRWPNTSRRWGRLSPKIEKKQSRRRLILV